MSTTPAVGVLALQGDVREHLRMLAAAGARAVAVRRERELAEVDGLVLPGGESTTIARLAAAFDLLSPLRRAVKAGLPVYGSCAGMILLADRILDGADGQETVGGLDVVVRRNAFGRQVDSFEADLELHPELEAGHDTGHDSHRSPEGRPAGRGKAFRAVFIRAPWVESAGPDVRVLARVGEGPAVGRIVAVRQGVRLATSFHPELTGDERVHRYFVDLVRTCS